MLVRALIFSFAMLALSSPAHAVLFRNSYISFELPPAWECKPDGTDWVCTNTYAKAAKEAIIIFTAKEVGPVDTLANYENHLKTPKSIPDKTGKYVPSKVEQVTQRRINNQPWVDGMHLGSEIASYYTRYLATVKDRIAILVTFSAHKDHYTKYSSDFINAIGSLQVVAAKDLLDSRPKQLATGVQETVGTPITPEPITGPVDLPPSPTGNGKDLSMKLFGVALLLAAAGYYLWRKRNQ